MAYQQKSYLIYFSNDYKNKKELNLKELDEFVDFLKQKGTSYARASQNLLVF